jgi:transcriptional regulator with XRE-family HTH domain
MSDAQTFGPDLRRIRIERGLSIEAIAKETKITADLLAGLERNDFARWPTGLYARAYVRAYAQHIGVDPDATVDEFCRWFPQGDRRAERRMREHSAIVDHQLEWRDDRVVAGSQADRRARPAGSQPLADFGDRLSGEQIRLGAAAGDALAVALLGALGALLVGGWAAPLAVCAILYFSVSTATLGCTPSVWLVDTYLTHRYPQSGRDPRFRRLARGTSVDSDDFAASSF